CPPAGHTDPHGSTRPSSPDAGSGAPATPPFSIPVPNPRGDVRGCPERGQDPSILVVSRYSSVRIQGSCPLSGQPLRVRDLTVQRVRVLPAPGATRRFGLGSLCGNEPRKS